MTSLAFNAGNGVVGLYLGTASVTAAYGAAGSLVVVLLWLYFSAQFLLLGAEFTRAYAARFGAALSAGVGGAGARATVQPRAGLVSAS